MTLYKSFVDLIAFPPFLEEQRNIIFAGAAR